MVVLNFSAFRTICQKRYITSNYIDRILKMLRTVQNCSWIKYHA